jgi:hypothetical protein
MANGPRSFNIVTFLMLVCLAGAGYWIWKFFPVYFTAWQVDHVLSDGASRAYKVNRLNEPARSQGKQDLVEDLRRKVVSMGILDPEMALEVELDGDTVYVTCDYSVVVQHPVKNKQTVMTLHRKVTGDLKRVDWDN